MYSLNQCIRKDPVNLKKKKKIAKYGDDCEQDIYFYKNRLTFLLHKNVILMDHTK